MKQITVMIDETGEASVDLTGFHGQGCDKVLNDFSGGEDPKVVRHKPEYHERCQEKEKARG